MANLPTPDVAMPQILARENLPAPAAPPAPNSEAAFLAELGKKLDENGWKATMAIATNPPVDEEAVLRKREEIGFARNPATGEKTRVYAPAAGAARDLNTENGRYGAVQDAEEVALKFERSGFTSLGPTEQADIRTAITALVNGNATWQKSYDLAVTAGTGPAFIDKIINDPRYAREVRQALVDYAALPPLSDTAETTRDTVKEATRAKGLKSGEAKRIKDELADIDLQLASFDRRPSAVAGVPAGTLAGADAEEIRIVEANLPAIKADIARLAQQQGSQRDQVARLRNELNIATGVARAPAGAVAVRPAAAVRTLLTYAEDALATTSANIIQEQERVNNVAVLRDRETRLKADKQRLTPLLATAQSEVTVADNALKTAVKQQGDAASTRVSLEKARVAKIKGVFVEAAVKVMNERTTDVATVWPTVVESFKANAQTQYARSAFDHLDTRYVDPTAGPVRAKDDLAVLLTNGQESYVRRFLKDSINPDTGRKYDTAGPGGPAVVGTPEIDARIADAAFMASVKDQATTLLLAKSDMRKGGLTAAEESIIYNSSWGKDLLKNAYTSNNEFRAFVDSHGGRDALNNPGFVAKFKREWKGKSLFWLLLFAMPLLSAAKTAATSPNPYV